MTIDNSTPQNNAPATESSRTKTLENKMPENKTLQYKERLDAIEAAGRRIAPVWPLDQSIAVNPLWEQRQSDITQVAARVEAFGGISCLMPREYYAGLWQRSVIKESHLCAAAAELGSDETPASLLQALKKPVAIEHWLNVSDWLDNTSERQHEMAWRDEITHQISQFCASYLQTPDHSAHKDLYQSWVEQVRSDRGIAILMGEPGLTRAFKELPDDPGATILAALSELGIQNTEQTEVHAHSLLLDINGWASWLAYERWQAALAGQSDDALPQLIAIRLGWELALWRHWQWRHAKAALRLQSQWYEQLSSASSLIARHQRAQKPMWVWQRAAELVRQQEEQTLLRQVPLAMSSQPVLQAVFCIDVRSEVIRRALEAQSPKISTLGFAGFFGLPAAYTPIGTKLQRPQLPGLLAPQIRVTEGGHKAQALGHQRAAHYQRHAAWQDVSRGASTAFSMVEALGLGYVGKLLKRTFASSKGMDSDAHPVNDLETSDQWDLYCSDERPLTLSEKADIAGQMLKGLGLGSGQGRLASTVLLVGHGSQSSNNPHAAGLDCGACGGQTGAVNVQVMAQLLNNQLVRAELSERGQKIPAATRFVAALHNTTTDHITCYGKLPELESDEPASDIRQWLDDATLLAQRERAVDLGLEKTAAYNQPDRLDHEICQRAHDWSEVRPEWGLAGNSAFIIAPRNRTRGINFSGRAFLHDYDRASDSDFSVLESIMTAPMIVTHWINMQYNASVTDPLKYGSGNKVLHNVVGGNLGVFEGNGGDLRIGLPLQSVHDGQRWMHNPLRLSVYIQAPKTAISDIIDRHAMLQELVHNRWLYLFVLNDDGSVNRCTRNGREAVTQDLSSSTLPAASVAEFQ